MLPFLFDYIAPKQANAETSPDQPIVNWAVLTPTPPRRRPEFVDSP
jgi:hypothetical protein